VFNRKELEMMASQMQSLQAELSSLKHSFAAFQERFAADNTSFGEIHKSLEKIRAEQHSLVQELGIHIQQLQINREQFESEIRRFQQGHQQLSKGIAGMLQQELQEGVHALKGEMGSFREGKQSVQEMVQMVKGMNTAAQRLLDVSATIKSEDFALTKYLQQISRLDHEKGELLQRIDALERLVARERKKKEK